MAKEKITFRIHPLLVGCLRKEADQDYRKNSEMLRLVLEQSYSNLPNILENIEEYEQATPIVKARGEGVSVYLEKDLVWHMRAVIKSREGKITTMNQLINGILRIRYEQDG